MSREAVRTGAIDFTSVTKEYVIGRPRVHLAAALPFGDGLGRRGQRLRALDDVSFGIEPGEAFALIGANGAGKSTALKCLAGIVAPNAGSVRVGGRVVALIELGIGFHPDLSGLENARFAAALAGLRGRAAEELVEAAVEFSEIEKFVTTPVKRYSSGMYARLSFGIAQALPADILIVDEILAVGDLAFQRKCYARLAEYRREHGRTLVFVSHNEWVLKETCRRGVLLSHGRVIDTGPVDELLGHYHSSTAATPERFMAGESQRVVVEQVHLVPDDRRQYAMHDPLTVDVTVRVREDAVQPVVAAALFDAENRLIWGAYSDENDVTLDPGARHHLSLTIAELVLLPGPARLQVFAFDRSSPVIEDQRSLEIEISGDVPNRFENGLVYIPTTWALTRL